MPSRKVTSSSRAAFWSIWGFFGFSATTTTTALSSGSFGSTVAVAVGPAAEAGTTTAPTVAASSSSNPEVTMATAGRETSKTGGGAENEEASSAATNRGGPPRCFSSSWFPLPRWTSSTSATLSDCDDARDGATWMYFREGSSSSAITVLGSFPWSSSSLSSSLSWNSSSSGTLPVRDDACDDATCMYLREGSSSSVIAVPLSEPWSSSSSSLSPGTSSLVSSTRATSLFTRGAETTTLECEGDAAATRMYLREGSSSSSSASASEELAGDGLRGATEAVVHQGAFPALTLGAPVSPSSSVALASTLRSRRAAALCAAVAFPSPSFRLSARAGSSCHVSNQALHPSAAASYPPSASALANATASTLQLSAATSQPAVSASALAMASTLSPPARTMPLSRVSTERDGLAGTSHGLMSKPVPAAVLPTSLPPSSASWSTVLRS
mmetsp:Transcript_23360/g.69078  ORF Transcript_23360/g.69078 Transcript_23360/m.69078 type:complete len:441 (-) Transcript_23360:1381-2703(-)